MKKYYLAVILFLSAHIILSQTTNGVVSFDVPAKSTLKFNKYFINPTFSFVREDIPTLSLFNKRQWTGFENAPGTYLLNYSGKFQENNAFSAGAFQQNYGLLTTTGGIINYARNVMFDEESNLTFGLNIAFFKSGINTSKIISNTVDPLINTFTNNTILAINPGINYGIGFLDFGLSANNLVLYNLANSQAVANDPEKSFQGHVMYTGFIESNGYFDESKFTTLFRAETKKTTEFTANFMLEKPTLGWIQAGYNNIYGVSGGLGFNINQNISIGYNFEKGLGNISNLGNSHEFVLAYVFNEWEERTDGTGPTYNKTVTATPKVDPVVAAAEKARLENERLEKEKSIAEAKFKAYAAAKAKAIEDAKAKELADAAKAKAYADAKAKADADAKAKAALDTLSSAEKAKALAQAKIKADADAKAKIEADRAQAVIDAKERALALANNAKAAAAAKLKAEADAKAAFEAQRIANAKSLAEAKAKSDAEAKEAARLKAEAAKTEAARIAKEKADALERGKIETEKQKAEAARLSKQKAEDDAKAAAANADSAKAEAARIAKEKAEADKLLKDKAAADAKAKAEQAAIAKAESDKAKAEAAKIASDKAAADAKAKAEQAAKAKIEADRIAKEKAEADKLLKDKAAADAKAKADAIAQAKSDAEKAKAKVEADKLKAVADAKAKTEADAKAKLDAEKQKIADAAKAKADAEAERVRNEEERRKADLNKSETEKSLDYVKNLLEQNKKIKDQNLARLDSIANSRLKDLKDIKEENDLSDKGIVKAPKPFVSASAQNKALESIKNELAQSSKTQSEFLAQFQDEYNKRLATNPNKADPINQKYFAELEKLKADQAKTELAKASLLSKLDQIKTDIDIEKKRRIKRAAVETGQGRFELDRAALKRIKESTKPSAVALTPADFDFGEPENNNQILKKIENTQTGYYLVLASHTDVAKRDAFITKAISSGQINIDFFFDVNTGKYYIFTKKYDSLDESSTALEAKGNKPYNGKMFVVKIEN